MRPPLPTVLSTDDFEQLKAERLDFLPLSSVAMEHSGMSNSLETFSQSDAIISKATALHSASESAYINFKKVSMLCSALTLSVLPAYSQQYNQDLGSNNPVTALPAHHVRSASERLLPPPVRNGLPPTSLDSFVKNAGEYAEAIYGDEGSEGLPPYEQFTPRHRINMGIVDTRDVGLTTGHRSVLPPAAGGDEFVDTEKNTLSGSNGGSFQSYANGMDMPIGTYDFYSGSRETGNDKVDIDFFAGVPVDLPIGSISPDGQFINSAFQFRLNTKVQVDGVTIDLLDSPGVTLWHLMDAEIKKAKKLIDLFP